MIQIALAALLAVAALGSFMDLAGSRAAVSNFGVMGTPAAVRLGAKGQGATKLAVDADAVLNLLYDQIEAPEPALN